VIEEAKVTFQKKLKSDLNIDDFPLEITIDQNNYLVK
jgi:hypothetical protein